MVGRACTICINKRRAEIDAGLLSGRAHADLAREFGISNDAISRHARRHVSAFAAAGADQSLVPACGEVDLESSVRDLRVRLLRLLRRAEQKHDLRSALLAIRAAARLLELSGRLSGELDAGGVRVLINAGGGGSDVVRHRILQKLRALSPEPVIIEHEGTLK